MDFTKILAAGLAVLLAAGAVTAASPGSSPQPTAVDTGGVTNADVSATYDNGTVTLTLVDQSDGVANATVEVKREYQGEHDPREDDEDAYERVGTTDANGSVTFDLAPAPESRNVTAFEVHLAKGVLDAEVKYRVEEGSLSLLNEEYEYERTEDHEEYQNTTYNNTGQLNVSLADARATANATLEEPPQGTWQLVEAEAHEEDNYYEFEYTLVGADSPGEAEIRIHGDSGDVIKYEQEIEQPEEGEDERESEDENENEDEDERENENENEDERENEDKDEDERESEDENEDERENEDKDEDERESEDENENENEDKDEDERESENEDEDEEENA